MYGSPPSPPLWPGVLLLMLAAGLIAVMFAVAGAFSSPSLTRLNEDPVGQGEVLKFDADVSADSITAELVNDETRAVTPLKLREKDPPDGTRYTVRLPSAVEAGTYRLDATAREKDGKVLFREKLFLPVE